jgi:hypothetical protein
VTNRQDRRAGDVTPLAAYGLAQHSSGVRRHSGSPSPDRVELCRSSRARVSWQIPVLGPGSPAREIHCDWSVGLVA